METLRERVEREKSNLQVEISLYEQGRIPKANSKKQPMTDISGRMTYEFRKIELDVLKSRNEEGFLQLRKIMDNYGSPFTEFPKIRMLAAGGSSNGRTLKVGDLTEEELIKAREIAKQKVDEWLTNFRKMVV